MGKTLVRIHPIIEMILVDRPYHRSLNSLFQVASYLLSLQVLMFRVRLNLDQRTKNGSNSANGSDSTSTRDARAPFGPTREVGPNRPPRFLSEGPFQ